MFRLLFCLAVVSFATSEADVLYFKTPSSKDALEDVICPDKRSACPKTTTCCVLSTGAYGCCPLPQATCCSDHVHCCPHGNTCDIKKGRCLSAAGIVRSWVEKRPAKQLQGKSQPVICPDGHHQCPYGQTCCKQRGGDYGCCPFSQAMCCNDGLHCCPHDYKCDVSHGTCVKTEAISQQ